MSNEYYGTATTPTDDYLAHYGVKGMKWGVRRALKSGNAQKLGKAYAKASKKLAKLEKRAAKSKSYAKRAAAYGAGAALAGGLAAAGTGRVGSAMRTAGGAIGTAASNVGTAIINRGKGGKRANAIGLGLQDFGKRANSKLVTSGAGLEAWGKSTSASRAAQDAIEKATRTSKNSLARTVGGTAHKTLDRVSNDTLARIGAGAVGVGLGAAAAKNAYRAATAKKKAAKFRTEMNKAFAGTKYANGGSSSSNTSKKRRRSSRA